MRDTIPTTMAATPEAVVSGRETVAVDVAVAEDDAEGMYGDFAAASVGESRFIILENNLLKLTISSLGGGIYSAELKDYNTWDSKPLKLFDGDSSYFGLNFFANNRSISTNEMYFDPNTDNDRIQVTSSERSLSMKLLVADGQYIEYLYTLYPNSYMVDFRMRFKGMDQIISNRNSYLDLTWDIYSPQQEKGRTNESSYTTISYKYYQDEVKNMNARAKGEKQEEIRGRLRWVAFKQQFFSSVLIADDYFLSGTIRSTQMPDDSRYIKNFRTELSIPYEAKYEEVIPMAFYLGPNHYGTLKKHEMDLEQLVTLGGFLIKWINLYVIIPVFNFLNRFISNYGIIILLLTVFIKVVLFPLTYKSYLSQAKMRVLKPNVDEINKKFPKREDAMKKQQATMGLYKKAGVSPLGGCLPMVLQFPILFAMFRFFPTSIELRQESFLWATDLSTYDSILDLPFSIPMYGDHVSLFTILMTVSTILTMRLSDQTGASASQMPGMKGMMYIMPVMFMLILNNFSAGLTYYYFLANIITFGQNLIVKRFFVDESAILKKLEENKKKPAKKSKFQTRLNAMAKQRGVQLPKK
jgi:YidC/Oxa1 family membrane protein insertase